MALDPDLLEAVPFYSLCSLVLLGVYGFVVLQWEMDAVQVTLYRLSAW